MIIDGINGGIQHVALQRKNEGKLTVEDSVKCMENHARMMLRTIRAMSGAKASHSEAAQPNHLSSSFTNGR